MTDHTDAPPILIRTVGPGDDLDAQLDLAERSFGPSGPAGRAGRRQRLADRITDGRTVGAFDGDRPAGTATFHDMPQWWCGRVVPMAGVAGVMVAPEDRGRRIGRRLMAALLDEVAARGYPLSALYPATMPLYRAFGWELAGTRTTAVVPARSLRDLVPPDPTRATGCSPWPTAGHPGPRDAPGRRRGPHPGRARPGRAVRRGAAPVAASGGLGPRWLTRGRRRPGRGVRRGTYMLDSF